MSMEFDAVSKYLLDAGPAEWLALSGISTAAKLTPVDSELSTVTANADRLYRVEERIPWLVNFEPFSSRDKRAAERVCLYSLLASSKLALPVHTVVILLTKRAEVPEWTGSFESTLPGTRQPYLMFRYTVLRIWQIPPETLLKGGIATLALAPISKIGKNELPQLMPQVLARIEAEVPGEGRRDYLAAMMSLMGLRHSSEFLLRLFQGFQEMRESSVVQHWLKEGEAIGVAKGEAIGVAKGEAIGVVKGEREALLTILRSRFGKLSSAVTRKLSAIDDLKQVQRLIPFAVTDITLDLFMQRLHDD